MLAVTETVVPVFGIILAGYLTALFRLLPDSTTRGLSDFTFAVAMPALLFHTIVGNAPSTAPWLLLAAFFITDFVVWVLSTLIAAFVLRRPAQDWATIGMGAAFGNLAMLGLPLGQAFFGPPATAAIAVIIAVHSPILWVIGTLQHELGRGGARDTLMTRLAELALELSRNPIVVAVVLGALWRSTGLGLATIPDRMLEMLGAAGVPGALFALGLSLTRFDIRADLKTMATITALKLVAMPVIAYALCALVFRLDAIATAAVVLLAACPTGANAFLFASRYERAVSPVAGAIAIGTALSAVTITLLLLLLSRPVG